MTDRVGGRLSRRGSSRGELFGEDGFTAPYVEKEKMTGTGVGNQAAWSLIFRAYIPDYAVVVTLLVITVICEGAAPFVKVIYHGDDEEYWQYSYPLHNKNTVPAWTVPVIATIGPLLIFAAYAAVAKPSRLEMHNIVLGLLTAVFITSAVTNLVKLGVGRPRPNFVARCWPDGNLKFTGEGVPDCAADAVDPGEGRKSFPSGHTSWSTSGLAFLTFWLTGKLRCFDGSGHTWRIVVAALPISFAVWIGITRLQDYWHHPTDVMAGFALGFVFAYLSYRQHYPSPLLRNASEAYVATSESAGEPQRSFADLETGVLVSSV